jgi:hypothetical protein
MLRAIELGEIEEDILEGDPEDYDDMGGINSLKRNAPSIKMASETPEEEFDLELGTVIKEYNDLKEQGLIRDISIEEYIDKYLSKKGKSPKMMAGMGNVMKLFETPFGFDRSGFEDMLIQYEDSGAKDKGIKLYEFATGFLGMVKKDTPSDRSMAMYGGRMQYAGGNEDPRMIAEPPKAMQKDTTTGEGANIFNMYYDDQDIPIKKEGDKLDLDIEKIKKLIEKRKKEKVKRAKGGIAGVL